MKRSFIEEKEHLLRKWNLKEDGKIKKNDKQRSR